jgi:hypothetical protein
MIAYVIISISIERIFVGLVIGGVTAIILYLVDKSRTKSSSDINLHTSSLQTNVEQSTENKIDWTMYFKPKQLNGKPLYKAFSSKEWDKILNLQDEVGINDCIVKSKGTNEFIIVKESEIQYYKENDLFDKFEFIYG